MIDKVLSIKQVSEYQIAEMEHALGMNYRSKPFRNRFYTDSENKVWNDLVSKGFATKHRGWDKESAIFRLTFEAVKLIYGKPISKKYYDKL